MVRINKISKSLKYVGKQLFINNVDCESIIKIHKTPIYCYSSSEIIENYNNFHKSLKKLNPLICYAVKANFNKEIIKMLGKIGSGADVVSKGELKLALDAGINPSKIVFSGVGKTKEEIIYALRKKIFQINVESEEELDEINDLAINKKTLVNISIRVNPDVDANTHKKISTGRSDDKFGIPISKVVEIFKRKNNYNNLKINGIAIHIGSQITKIDPFKNAFEKIKKLIIRLEKNNINIKNLDLGGGIGINYFENQVISLKKYSSIIKKEFGRMNIKLIFEPGRSIVGSAGFIISKVIRIKKGLGKNFLILDVGMNDLMRPSLYESYHHIIPMKKLNSKRSNYDIVGPVCESSDIFGYNRNLNEVKSGDYLVLCSAGAYGSCMSSNYNCRPLIKEIIVNDTDFFKS